MAHCLPPCTQLAPLSHWSQKHTVEDSRTEAGSEIIRELKKNEVTFQSPSHRHTQSRANFKFWTRYLKDLPSPALYICKDGAPTTFPIPSSSVPSWGEVFLTPNWNFLWHNLWLLPLVLHLQELSVSIFWVMINSLKLVCRSLLSFPSLQLNKPSTPSLSVHILCCRLLVTLMASAGLTPVGVLLVLESLKPYKELHI